jgi:uncharacterized paraquat-inducible protein A
VAEEKIYCKKCGAWVVPENGECPRCGYVFEKKSKRIVLAVFFFILAAVLIKLLL